ncbi:MAG TPA: FtsW/RodA/SpoVE family cell cycle protein [Gaiellales bacterium]|nr:FtsW/RodA/SpoVE family cell cycle protein [Gaiellales bacterium]
MSAAGLRSSRNRELGLLLLVAAVVAVGFTSVLVARSGVVSTLSLTYAAAFLALLGVAHTALRVALPDADPVLLPAAGLLVAVGIVEIYRLDPTRARDQAIWLAIGVGCFIAVLAALSDYRVLERYRYLLGVASLLALAATIVSSYATGTVVNGARVWIRVGGLSFQPGEFAKLGLVLFMAAYLREKRELLASREQRVLGLGLPHFKHLSPLALMVGGALALLVLMNDFGTSLLFFGVFLAMLYLATSRLIYVVGGLLVFALGAYLSYRLVPHVAERVDIWLHPWADVYGRGYQSVQALYAIADGGAFGTGLGRGYLLTNGGQPIVPAIQTDFIYAAIANETGLAGVAALLLVYLLVVQRGLKTASLAGDGFSKLLAAGLTIALGLQVFLIVGGIVRAAPLTGITLPFVSYGGSSLVANWVALALLCAISDRARREAQA